MSYKDDAISLPEPPESEAPDDAGHWNGKVVLNVRGSASSNTSTTTEASFDVGRSDGRDKVKDSISPTYQRSNNPNNAFQNQKDSSEILEGTLFQSDDDQEVDLDNQNLAAATAQGLASIRQPLESHHSIQTPVTQNVAPRRGPEVKPKGEVRFHATGMQYRESASMRWLPAVYHYNLRSKFITQSFRKGEYRFPDPEGEGWDDKTSFLMENKDWGPAWHQRPEILRRFARTDLPVPTDEPVTLNDSGRVVIDQENHAIAGWKELPLCISSKVPGYKMEAWRRLNPKITIFDFMARMPKSDRPMTTDRNKLSMRMTRFRLRAACISWVEREGCWEIKEHISSLIGPTCVAENSTAAFGRDLTDSEIRQATAGNKGKFPRRRRKKNKLRTRVQVTGPEQHSLAMDTDKEDDVVKIEDEGKNNGLGGRVRRRQKMEESAVMAEAQGVGGSRAPFSRRRKNKASSFAGPAPRLTNTLRPQQNLRHFAPRHQDLQGQGRTISATTERSPQSTSRAELFPAINSQQLACEVHQQFSLIEAEHQYVPVPSDPRYLEPRNMAEASSIQRALEYTRRDFAVHFAEEAPLTDTRKCYAYQYHELRDAFVRRWPYPPPVPRPDFVEDWGSTVMEWRKFV